MNSSIHSSLDEAAVPAQATSLITTLKGLKAFSALRRWLATGGGGIVDDSVGEGEFVTVCVTVAVMETVGEGVYVFSCVVDAVCVGDF